MSSAEKADMMLSTPTKNPLGMQADAREFVPDSLREKSLNAGAREFVPSTPSTCSSTVLDSSVVATSSPSEADDGGANYFDDAQAWSYLPANCHDDFGIVGAGCVPEGDANFLAEACALPLQQWPLSLEQLPSLQPQDMALATPGAAPILTTNKGTKAGKGQGRRRNRGRGDINGADVPLVLSTMPPPLPVPGFNLSTKTSLTTDTIAATTQKKDSPRSQLLTMCGAWGALVNNKKMDSVATVISIDPSAGISRRELLRFKAACAKEKCPSPLATFKASPAHA
jgi:hypothetical protein